MIDPTTFLAVRSVEQGKATCYIPPRHPGPASSNSDHSDCSCGCDATGLVDRWKTTIAVSLHIYSVDVLIKQRDS